MGQKGREGIDFGEEESNVREGKEDVERERGEGKGKLSMGKTCFQNFQTW
jgi:uncharacterized protein YheU (UPF0270 family)